MAESEYFLFPTHPLIQFFKNIKRKNKGKKDLVYVVREKKLALFCDNVVIGHLRMMTLNIQFIINKATYVHN